MSEQAPSPPGKWTRRRILRTGALSGAAALGGGVMLANQRSEHRDPVPPAPTVYLPTWLDDAHYDKIGNTLRQAKKQAFAIGRLVLAFAEPSSAELITPPAMPRKMVAMLLGLPEGQPELGLSIGGGQARNSNDWKRLAAQPDRFAQKITGMLGGIQKLLQRPVTLIDMDCETDVPPQDLTGLMQALRRSAPAAALTMAVPAQGDIGRFDTKALQSIVSEYNIMAYDEHGPEWSETAGCLSSKALIHSAAERWSAKIGESARLRIGIPAYGYLFAGATGEGDTFDRLHSRAVVYSDIPVPSAHDDLAAGTSTAHTAEGYIAFQSTAVIRSNIAAVRQQHPGVGTFFWSAEGLTPQHLAAVRP